MNYNNVQVRLTMKMEGRLGASVSNSASKEEIAKVMSGKELVTPFNERGRLECYRTLDLKSEYGTPAFAVSEEGRPRSIDARAWSSMSKKQRLISFATDLASSLDAKLTDIQIFE